MRNKVIHIHALVIAAAVVIGSGFVAADAHAFAGFEFTRAKYDVMMRWINFIIMVALFFKYARKPLIDFLQKQRGDVINSIEQMEERKKDAQKKIDESKAMLAANQERLKAIQEKIGNEGRQRKEQIIEDARHESRLMIEAARAKVEGQVREAVFQFKSELIDNATQRAAQQLPLLLKKEDHNTLVQRWLTVASQ